MSTIRLDLRQYLDIHGLSAYRLAEAAGRRVSRGTIYALARGDVTRIDLNTLGAVITTLEELTGGPVTPNDLLQVEAAPVLESDQESTEWEAADLMPPLPEYNWGQAGEPCGEPVRYVPGLGFVTGAGDA